MIVRNIYQAETHRESAHGGSGEVLNTLIFGGEIFKSTLEFVIYTELEPGAGIGYHTHGEDEEIYRVLAGQGRLTVNGETRQVHTGGVILNRPGWSHGLENEGPEMLKIFVFEAKKSRSRPWMPTPKGLSWQRKPFRITIPNHSHNATAVGG